MQIEKLKSRGIGMEVLKQDVIPRLDNDVKFVYVHDKAFVENDAIRKPLRSSFKERIKAVVIDEAHFIIQW